MGRGSILNGSYKLSEGSTHNVQLTDTVESLDNEEVQLRNSVIQEYS